MGWLGSTSQSIKERGRPPNMYRHEHREAGSHYTITHKDKCCGSLLRIALEPVIPVLHYSYFDLRTISVFFLALYNNVKPPSICLYMRLNKYKIITLKNEATNCNWLKTFFRYFT